MKPGQYDAETAKSDLGSFRGYYGPEPVEHVVVAISNHLSAAIARIEGLEAALGPVVDDLSGLRAYLERGGVRGTTITELDTLLAPVLRDLRRARAVLSA
jgi:hypothetical protein